MNQSFTWQLYIRNRVTLDTNNHHSLTDDASQSSSIPSLANRITVSDYFVSSFYCRPPPHRRCSSSSWTIVPRITAHESWCSCQEKIQSRFLYLTFWIFLFPIFLLGFIPVSLIIKYVHKWCVRQIDRSIAVRSVAFLYRQSKIVLFRLDHWMKLDRCNSWVRE